LIPLNLIPTPSEEAPVLPTQEPKRLKSFTPEWKELFWKSYVNRTAGYERRMVIALKNMFNKQEKRAIGRLGTGSQDLIYSDEAKQDYTEAAKGILTDLLVQSIRNGTNLVNPKPAHRAEGDEPPLNPRATEWLETRIGWAAAEVGEETARLLSHALAEGFEEGEDMRKLAKRVRDTFNNCDRVRSILIARTETIMASNEGALLGYQESGVVEKVEFYAALDERLCDDCNDMHGEVFNLAEAHGIIPLHPDCRCTWIPII